MKQKFVFYILIFFVNTSQSMDIISALHNLEQKLTQLEPFLAKQESQKIESADVPQLLADLESYVNAIENNIQALEQHLTELFRKVTGKISKDFETNFDKLSTNAVDCFTKLTNIGNHYKKGLLNQNQKTKLSSVLDKFKNIFVLSSLKNIDLNPLKNSPLIGTIEKLEMLRVNVPETIDKIILIVQNKPTNSISKYIMEDSEKIAELEGKIRRVYAIALTFIDQIKQFGASGEKSKLEEALEKLEEFPDDDLTSLRIEIFKTITYASFIKDDKLKKILLTALKSQNLTFSQKLTEETNNIKSLFSPEMSKSMDYIINLVETLENEIEEAESILT